MWLSLGKYSVSPWRIQSYWKVTDCRSRKPHCTYVSTPGEEQKLNGKVQGLVADAMSSEAQWSSIVMLHKNFDKTATPKGPCYDSPLNSSNSGNARFNIMAASRADHWNCAFLPLKLTPRFPTTIIMDRKKVNF